MLRKTIFTALVVMLTFGLAVAQAPTGKIVGRVTDAEGAPLPGVSVTCDSTRLVGVANAVTDETGTYRIFSLPSGTYSVRFTLPGFKTLTRRDIILQLEQTISLNVNLEQSALAEEVTVVGQSPLIDVKSTVKGSTMTKEVFMQLPRNRNFTGLLATVPGVSYEGSNGMLVDGASGGENMWFIDGTDITSVHRGSVNSSIVMEQLDEVKVTASGYNAEFGGSLGGVISVISRSGGNEFHGDIFGYYNNNRLWMQGHDRNSLRLYPYDQTKAEYYNNDDLYYNGGKDRDNTQRFEGVFNLGGFIFKDRLWFFASFNPIYSYTFGDRFFNSDPVDLTKAKIPGDLQYDPRQGRDVYNFYSKTWQPYWAAKLTAMPFKGLRMSVSGVSNWYTQYGQIPGLTGTSAKNFPYTKGWTNTIYPNADKEPGWDYPNLTLNMTADYTASSNFLIGLRAGYNVTDRTNPGVAMPGTQYTFNRANTDTTLFPDIPDQFRNYAGYTNWGATAYAINSDLYSRAAANLDATYYTNLAGEHAFKFGVQYNRIHENSDNAIQHPTVFLNWNDFIDLPQADGSIKRCQGKYGYYTIISDFKTKRGLVWDVSSNNWAFYLQDSWTIGQKLTLNFGFRNEAEYIPAMTNDTTEPGYSDKPFKFGFLYSYADGKSKFFEKFAPRLGAVYDVFGDSSLKVFGSFGIYYDVMKLYIAQSTSGGDKWWTSYYTLDNYDWTKIAASGDVTNKADQTAGGTYYGSRNWRHTAFTTIDPNLHPMSQSETSVGVEKKVTEDVSFSVRGVYKHLIRAIEDVGVLEADAEGNMSEAYYQANPGFGYTLPESSGGKMLDKFWPCPKAKREYWGLNVELEKRFSNNWQGGVSYTLSRIEGNYGGINSQDETARWGANQNRYFDLWFERYDIHGKPLDGAQPYDRTHYFRAYGSYAFPFGLTVGVAGYGRSGYPITTTIPFRDMTVMPENYGDLGRLPFTFYADMYLEYNLRIAKKYLVNLNATINNVTNTKTVQSYSTAACRTTIYATDDEHLTGNFDWKAQVPTHTPDPRFNLPSSYYGAWTLRLGARFSF
jgi:hypothetical protein